MSLERLSRYPSSIYRVSVKAVIRNEENEVLVCKEYDQTAWGLPGGGWDHHETEYEALARELKEEVNYSGNFTAKPVKTAVFWAKSHESWLLWIVYEVKIENMNFSPGKDTTAVAFVDPKVFKEEDSPVSKWLANYFEVS